MIPPMTPPTMVLAGFRCAGMDGSDDTEAVGAADAVDSGPVEVASLRFIMSISYSVVQVQRNSP